MQLPHGIGAAETEINFGETGFQLLGATHVSDLDLCFLTTEREQVDPTYGSRRPPEKISLAFAGESVDGIRLGVGKTPGSIPLNAQIKARELVALAPCR